MGYNKDKLPRPKRHDEHIKLSYARLEGRKLGKAEDGSQVMDEPLTPEDCPLCKGSGEILKRKIRMMGYTLYDGETIDEELVPCPLCEYIKAQLALSQKHQIDRFRRALEQSRKGEPPDLSEEDFALFSDIQTEGIIKAQSRGRYDISISSLTVPSVFPDIPGLKKAKGIGGDPWGGVPHHIEPFVIAKVQKAGQARKPQEVVCLNKKR